MVGTLGLVGGITFAWLWQGHTGGDWPWGERVSPPPAASRMAEPAWMDADSVPLVLAGQSPAPGSGDAGTQAAPTPASAAARGGEAALADSGRSWPPGVVGLAPGQPGRGQACSPCGATLDLCARLSPGVSLVELTCDTTGAYVLAGESPAAGPVEAFLDTLRQARAPAVVTWWSIGSASTNSPQRYRFVMRGQHQTAVWPRPAALSAPDATAVLRRLALLARRLGLPGVIPAPANVGAAGGGPHALSTAGTPAQVRSLLDGLRQEAPRVVLTAVAVAPHGDGTVPPQTQLSVAFELALARP